MVPRAFSGHYCIAEEIIGGRQCTIEGYSHGGKVTCTGIIDSIRYPQVLSFFRYQYPSRLPERIQHEMERITDRIITHVGYDNSSFNIEYFWDEVLDKVWLLEVNTRISQSHSDIFEKVDGVSNQQLTIDLALGRRPNMPAREHDFPLAGKFFHRVFSGNARVKRAPTTEEIRAVEKDFPGTHILPQVEPGMWLSELSEQDSYSFALAYIYMGAEDEESLLANYERVLKRLPFELEKIDDTFARPTEESHPPA